MELTLPMPVIQFKPSEGKRKGNKGIYPCPCYYYQVP